MASAYKTRTATARRARSKGPDCEEKAGGGEAHGSPVDAPNVDSLISATIIPHLLLIKSGKPAKPRLAQGDAIHPHEAEQFATLPLTLEADELLDIVEAYIERGVCVESIFVDLLAPAARKLGEMWEADNCDFVDVTMGLWRLQEVLRTVAQNSPALIEDALAPRSILISAMPGDQHSFGALMLDEVFVRAGWASEVLIEARRRELLSLLTERAFDIVGLTLSIDCPSALLSEFINSLRSVSKNPKLIVLVGGRLVHDNPAIVESSGADGTAADARSAVRLAEQLVTRVRPLATAIN